MTIGFSRAELSERALYNLETRDFLGLTDADEAEVGALVEAGTTIVFG